MKKTGILVLGAVLLSACGGADRATRKNILEWAEVLQVHIATTKHNRFPERLGDVDPDLRAHLSRTDGWGKDLLYKRIRQDRYMLISAGPDGAFGNDDDILAVTGHIKGAAETYAKRPLSSEEKSR